MLFFVVYADKMCRKLYATPRSHFSRKVRILLAALNLEVDLIDIGNVAKIAQDGFGANPLMKVPTLVDGQHLVFDSDHIAQYIVRQYDPKDRFDVFTSDLQRLNARAVMNGIMAAEVELILAARSGIDIQAKDNLRYDKIRAAIVSGLTWLEDHAHCFPAQPCYLGFHLVAMGDHLAWYKLVPLAYPKLQAHINALSSLAYIKASAL